MKQQLNKRKPDDEFAALQFSHFSTDNREIMVACPESNASSRASEPAAPVIEVAIPSSPPSAESASSGANDSPSPETTLRDRHITNYYGETGYSYEKIMGAYLVGAKVIDVEDPYLRIPHQIAYFTRFCELMVTTGTTEKIKLKTEADDPLQGVEISERLDALSDDLKGHELTLEFKFDPHLHDRGIRLDNGWLIKIGRGFDVHQKIERPRSGLGMNAFDLRPCPETTVDIFRESK